MAHVNELINFVCIICTIDIFMALRIVKVVKRNCDFGCLCVDTCNNFDIGFLHDCIVILSCGLIMFIIGR